MTRTMALRTTRAHREGRQVTGALVTLVLHATTRESNECFIPFLSISLLLLASRGLFQNSKLSRNYFYYYYYYYYCLL